MQAMKTKRSFHIFRSVLPALFLLFLLTACAPADLQQLTGAAPGETYGVSELPLGTTVDLTGEAEYNNKAVLRWSGIPDADRYRVYRGRTLIATMAASDDTLSFTDCGLRTGRTYTYEVNAYQEVDGTFMFCGSSEPVSVRAIFRQPRLVMFEEDETHKVLPSEFRRLGCTVTSADTLKEADPSDYDALIVPGGGDVDPSLWGDPPHPAAGPFTPDTDRLQIRVIDRFAKAGKPILGICRGAQLINVAFGGTMIQNLYPNETSPTYEDGFHTVRNEKNSWVGQIYGKKASVYFHHHQAVDRPGHGIRITSWSKDHPYRHAEAIEHESLPIYGVQWHPDTYVERQGNEIYKAFVRVCLENMAQ